MTTRIRWPYTAAVLAPLAVILAVCGGSGSGSAPGNHATYLAPLTLRALPGQVVAPSRAQIQKAS